MLRTSLELSGRPYDITVVASAEEALLELQHGPIDMVVTDLRLPGMSGLELLARIRQTNPKLRAILITGQPTNDVRAQAQAPPGRQELESRDAGNLIGPRVRPIQFCATM